MLPPESKFKKWWDRMIIMLVMYNTLFIILVVCYSRYDPESGFYWYTPGNPGTLNPTPMVIDYVIDIAFWVDIYITFLTTFFDAENELVLDKKIIARNYLKWWFPVGRRSLCTPLLPLLRRLSHPLGNFSCELESGSIACCIGQRGGRKSAVPHPRARARSLSLSLSHRHTQRDRDLLALQCTARLHSALSPFCLLPPILLRPLTSSRRLSCRSDRHHLDVSI